jgi:hypothetical protein
LLGANTPERDLGLVLTYGKLASAADSKIIYRAYARVLSATTKRPERIRYSMESHMEPEVPAGTAKPPEAAAPPQEEAPGMEYTPEMHHEYMKHCYSHKYAKMHHTHFLTKHAMEEKPAEVEATSGAVAPEEHMPPEPSAYSAAAVPGPGTGPAYVPGGLNDPKGNEKYSKLEREFAEQKSLIGKLLERDTERSKREQQITRDRDLERYARVLTQLVESDGVDLSETDIQDEATLLVGMPDDAARQKHLTKIKTKYSRRPTGRMAMDLTRLTHTVEGGLGPTDDNPRDQTEYDAAVSYASSHPNEIDFNSPSTLMQQAVRKYRASRNGANGSTR